MAGYDHRPAHGAWCSGCLWCDATAEDAHEARMVFINDFATHPETVLITRHSPAQIHVEEVDAMLDNFVAKSRDNKAHRPDRIAARAETAMVRKDWPLVASAFCPSRVTSTRVLRPHNPCPLFNKSQSQVTKTNTSHP